MKWLTDLWKRFMLWFAPPIEAEIIKLVPPSVAELKAMNTDEPDAPEIIWNPKEPRTGKPLRYDEVERERKRKRKGL